MIIVDAHQDIAMNALGFGRDYRKPAHEKRQLERDSNVAWKADATVGLPDALLGRLAVVCTTLFALPDRAAGDWLPPGVNLAYANERQAHDIAMRQLDYYAQLTDEDPRLQRIHTQTDLNEVLETWAEGSELGTRRQGLVMLMEGADPILEPQQFEEWYERGIRIVGPAWRSTRYTGGTHEPGALTRLGYELLEVMASLNAMLDLSHMAEEAFLQALEAYEGVVVATHSNPRRFRNTDRHLSDEMIRLLADRDGVMGIVPYNSFLRDGWSTRDPRLPFSIVTDAIDYVCQLTGSAAHVAIGSDFDGGFGYHSLPQNMDTVTDLWHIGGALREKGYEEDDIAAILSGNMLRKLRAVLPE